MTKLGKFIQIVITCFLLNSCGENGEFFLCKHAELSIEASSQVNGLKTTGYYSVENTANCTVGNFVFLYRDGTVFQAFCVNDQGIPQFGTPEELQERKLNWGVFRVTNDSIFIENWIPKSCGVDVNLRNGPILNDTTFLILKSKTRDFSGGLVSEGEMNDTFTFKYYSPKPDSTNSFIQ